MGLDVPTLDERDYEELVAQAKKLIPAHSDSWTDFNPHDPGITILEVLAWLTESHTYQLDQITDDHREQYLRLIGHAPRPPAPANAAIALHPPATAAGTRLPAGTTVSAADGSDDGITFETDHDVVLTDTSIDRVVTTTAAGITRHDEANRTEGMFYRPFGDEAARGDAVALGFDHDPFATSDHLTLWIEYHDDPLPEPAPTATGTESVSLTPSVALEWAYRDPDRGHWEPLRVVSDGTTALYEGGPIELARSEADTVDTTAADRIALDESVVWLRCRVLTPGYEIPPQVECIRTNVASVSHAVTVTGEELGPLRGTEPSITLDGQTYEFPQTPVQRATVFVDGEQFSEVPDFHASGPDDPHYVLDRERGHVTFGDGERGRVPSPSATITADYVYGGGTVGNVSPGAVWHVTDSEPALTADVTPVDVGVTAHSGATGGTDAESIDAALRRARRDLRRPHRAVTEADFHALAASTPGLRIGRTTVSTDGSQTTVVVVPYAPPDVPAPEPSQGMLETVRSHLRDRTLLTDRVRVIGPRYVHLELTVSCRTRPRFASGGHEVAIRDAVTSHLHPLFGADGDGWPFGRSITTSELSAVIAEVDAIDHVADVSITAHGGTTFDGTRVSIDDRSLFAVAGVTVETASGGAGT